MEPVILALEEKYEKKIQFIIVDVDDPEGQQMAQDFGVYYIPAFFYIDSNGEIIGEDSGGQSYERLEQRIKDLL
ncbi:MAG: thioredoxin domain-containing protein [Bacillota bacterium]|nr:thioredoxin domain-containing protein [Bacillota bacterium]